MTIMFETQGEVRPFTYPEFRGIAKEGRYKHSFAGFEGSTLKEEGTAPVFQYENYDKPAKKNNSLLPLMGEDSQFNSFEFIQDHTILTNVEDYANRVKHDADEYQRNVKTRMDSLKSEAEKINSQAKSLKEKAEAEVETMVSDAKGEVEEIKSKAYREGHAKGYADGKRKSLDEGKSQFEKLAKILTEIKKLRLSIFQQHESELVSICLVMARMVVGNELKTNRNMVLEGIGRIIKKFEGMGKVKIRLNPVDYDFVMNYREMFEELLDDEQKLSLKKDESAGPGAPVIESKFNSIDMDIKKQFSVLDASFKKCGEERAALYHREAVESERNGGA